MEVYYALAFETDLGTTLNIRVSNAEPDLPQSVALAAMDKILAANCFDTKYGVLIGKKSLKCVKIVTTPIDLDE